MRIQIISVIFCFITGISSYASSRNSVEFNGSDEVIFSDKLVNSFKLLDLLQSKVSRAENFDFNDPKIQSMIHDVVLENIDLYLSVVREECDCEAVPLEQELRSLQDQIVRKFKRVLKEIVGFGQEMVWVEVQGLRRYGIIYIVITAIGEIIDHSISPIPLCKAIAFLSRGISSYVKENGLIFFGSFSDHHSFNWRMKKWISKMIYQHRYKRRLRDLAKVVIQQYGKSDLEFEKRGQFWISSIDRNNNLKVVDVNLGLPAEIMSLYSADHFMDGLEIQMEIFSEQIRELRSLSRLSGKNYYRALWYLGELGSYIDFFRVDLWLNKEGKLNPYQKKIYSHFQEVFTLKAEDELFLDKFQNRLKTLRLLKSKRPNRICLSLLQSLSS